jgi:hypothetical protein
MTAIPWLAAALQLFTGATTPLERVIPPPGLTVSARSCLPCHADVVTQWSESAHGGAFTNSLFRASFKYERRAWCVNCHAPLPEQASGPLRGEGVNCAACHMRDGAILAARPATAAAAQAHPIVVEPRLAQADLCAGCHQFNWPLTMEPVLYGPHPMQNTVAEWQERQDAKTCVDCHMVGGHRMPGGHDVGWVRRALEVSIAARSRQQLRVQLRSHDVGHAVPSGDPFRRLVVQLCASPACTPPLQELFFGRRFDSRHNGALVGDSTVPAGGTRALDLRAPAGARFWRLVYRYVASGTQRDLDADEAEQEISNGRIGGGR